MKTVKDNSLFRHRMQFQTQKYHLFRLRAFEKIDFILVTETYTSCFSKEASLWIHEDTSFMSCFVIQGSSLSPQLEQRTHPSLRAQTLHYTAVCIVSQHRGGKGACTWWNRHNRQDTTTRCHVPYIQMSWWHRTGIQ